MTNQIDLSTDWLADAVLTTDQRRVWDHVRGELINARVHLNELEERLRAVERQAAAEGHVQSVLTRPEFNREVARMLAFDERYGGLSSMVYIDFDNLPEIAAKFGRAVANAATRTICDTLAKNVRSSDILGRLGTNEFGIMLVRCDNAQAWKKGESLASRLHEALGEVHGHKIGATINFGAYTFRENEDVNVGLKQAAETVTKSHDQR